MISSIILREETKQSFFLSLSSSSVSLLSRQVSMMDDIEVIGDQDLSSEQLGHIDNFVSCTGESRTVAQRALEACDWNVEMAINIHMDSLLAEPPAVVPPVSNVQNNLNQPSSSRFDEDEVRAPIPPVRQVLVHDHDVAHFPQSARRSNRQGTAVFDHFRDFRAEADYMQSHSPGEQAKIRSLEDLFRPPLDLMFRGQWESAREEGQRLNKWLMVNVQNSQEFSCQVLNRDVWSNPAVKELVSEHFLFWQVYNTSRDGERYIQFYPVNQYPYIAIIDPRTGELVQSWNNIQSPDIFCEQITDFLRDRPSLDGTTNHMPVTTLSNLLNGSTSQSSTVMDEPQGSSIYDEDEEAQLAAAIKASLEPSAQIRPIPISIDSDSEGSNDSYVSGNSATPKIDDSSPEEIVVRDVVEKVEDYNKYLGSESSEKTELVLRFPDGNKEKMSFPVDSKLKALFLYVQSKGYGLDKYDLVTNFPRRNIHDLSPDDTLAESKVLREQLYIHPKNS